jgi:proton-dependent oligopeptide transporter, POT family
MDEKLKHPKGLYILFAIELWERFGYYTTMAVFAYYMSEYFQLPTEKSGQIYGLFTGFVYFMPILGGFLADRVFGYVKSILMGAVLLSAGYAMLAIKDINLFYVSLVVIIAGNSLFKPNISTMVGNLYPPGSPLLDRAFNIFYMGINIGALIAPFVAAYLRYNFGWSYAFLGASVGMLIAFAITMIFRKEIKGADIRRGTATGAAPAPELSKEEFKLRITALVLLFVISLFYWTCYFQNFYSISYYTRDFADLSILPGFLQKPEIQSAINPIYIVLFTLFIVVPFWSYLNRKKKEPSTPAKIGWGMFLTALAYMIMVWAGHLNISTGMKSSFIWLVMFNLVLTMGELCVSPMGLSYCAKVAPPGMKGLAMGAWFGSLGVGAYLSGFLGTFWAEKLGEPGKLNPRDFFLIIVAISIFATICLKIALKKLARASGGT